MDAQKGLLTNIVRAVHLDVIDGLYHQFPNKAVTASLMLKQSHISTHTYPEERFCVLDIFTDAAFGDAEKQSLVSALNNTYPGGTVTITENIF